MLVFNDIEDESEGVMESEGYTDLSSLNFSDDSFVSGACFDLRVNRSMDMCVVDCLFGVLLSVVYSFVAVAIVYFDASVHRL